MSAPKEILASELGVDGISAWGRIYDTVSSKMTFEMIYSDGTKKRLPMSQRRSLMESPQREIRKAAFSGGNAAWEEFEDIAAGAINAISGTRHTLYRHREIDHFLDVALFDAAISRQTLDSMMEAIRETVELPRSILRLKAETLGLRWECPGTIWVLLWIWGKQVGSTGAGRNPWFLILFPRLIRASASFLSMYAEVNG